jgi:hypothetical protein
LGQVSSYEFSRSNNRAEFGLITMVWCGDSMCLVCIEPSAGFLSYVRSLPPSRFESCSLNMSQEFPCIRVFSSSIKIRVLLAKHVTRISMYSSVVCSPNTSHELLYRIGMSSRVLQCSSWLAAPNQANHSTFHVHILSGHQSTECPHACCLPNCQF